MRPTKSLLSELFQKYLSNQATLAERHKFLEYADDPLYKDQIQELISHAFENQTETELADLNKSALERVLNQIFKAKELPQIEHINSRLWLRIAAAIVITVGTTLFYFNQKNSTNQQDQIAKSDIKPGGNKAYLTLANGKKISLTDAKNGVIAKQTGVIITKASSGQLIYASAHNGFTGNEYNIIETPKGGQYKIQLPDGTAVWLNAASSLKYPASFKLLSQRKVILKGEAYFEVAKDKAHPFIVSTDKQQVEVLGTVFNINSYADEPSTKTTLLEGSVKLNGNTILKPGQQAALEGNKISVTEVNVNKAIAWKNGKFVFTLENIESIMRKLARWYNVEVIYEGDVKSETFTGSISCYDNISSILDKIAFTQAVHFKIEGRRITVMK